MSRGKYLAHHAIDGVFLPRHSFFPTCQVRVSMSLTEVQLLHLHLLLLLPRLHLPCLSK